MDNRRSFLRSLCALAAAPRLQSAPQQSSPQSSRTAGVVQLPAPFDHQSATFIEVDFAPGQRSAPHKHPGFVLGYVLEGEFRFQIAGQPERTLRRGETFYEPPGATHLVAETANPNQPARILAIVIAEPGKALVEPA
jgi:quercetin dioxygenase-like cupin family protein